jgi:hypothetical protein
MSSPKADTFFDDHVIPNFREWSSLPTACSRAMNLAISLNHLADYYWREHQTDLSRPLNAINFGDFRRRLVELTPEYGLVRDVADAHKHFKLDRADRNITHATQAAIGAMGWGDASWGAGTWGGAAEVIVTFDDGSKHHFSTAVLRVMSMWRGLLGRPEGQYLEMNSGDP